MKKFILAVALLTFSGCASDYKFGDISSVYCNSSDPEFRAGLKLILDSKGVSIGVDYCAAYGLVDVLAIK